ncbi:2'-5' RNA ligase family protein [Mumia qirimensis]|uniref:2'-5' RNA ligase family protein n=1 Tax=Mumia qirimensis TaxID=3234852 RepID=UPI00351D50A8
MTFVEDLAVPEAFGRDAWPLHLTWVPPFEAEEEAALEAVSRVAHGRTALVSEVVGEAWFGSRHDVRVGELARTAGVDTLHRDLLAALSESGVDVARMRHVRDEFRPHVSAQRGRSLAVGATVRLDAVTLVDMRPDGDPRRRRVVRTWPLDPAVRRG